LKDYLHFGWEVQFTSERIEKDRLTSKRSFCRLKVKQRKKKNYDRLTHAYVHWLADVHSGSFAPAFTLSFHDSERSRKPPNAHSLGR
jgi:hypothetical protein